MYINFWYPMIRSEDLSPGKPEKVKVLGLNFAVFRTASGEPAVLSDTCVHRGGSLAGPWELGQQPRIVKDCVVCPYHGWEFSADGSCVNIPSIGYGTKPPSRAKVDAYPTVEKYGIVFAFLGDLPENERPPLLEVPEWDQPGWRANSILTLDLNYYYERSIENGLDPAHNEYVHTTHGYQGEREDTYTMMELRPFKNNDWGFYSFFKSGWKRFYLKWYDDFLPSARTLCPKTVELLNSIPSVHGAMFAMLPPGGKLGAHRDPFAGSLRYHLGLVTPNSDKCRILVDGVECVWRDGEAFMFDETFIHSAENKTDVNRIILFCDVERPMKYGFMTAINRWVSHNIVKASATQNVEGERVGVPD